MALRTPTLDADDRLLLPNDVSTTTPAFLMGFAGPAPERHATPAAAVARTTSWSAGAVACTAVGLGRERREPPSRQARPRNNARAELEPAISRGAATGGCERATPPMAQLPRTGSWRAPPIGLPAGSRIAPVGPHDASRAWKRMDAAARRRSRRPAGSA